jgi:hypothetical protein
VKNNKDQDLQIVEFFWNRLTYWQRKWMRLDASIETANAKLLHWLVVLIALIVSFVTRGLPRSERRIEKTAHYIRERRTQKAGGPVLATFLFIVATLTVTAWAIAVQSPAHIAAPVLFITIVFLNILIIVGPTLKSRSKLRVSSNQNG